MESFGFNKINFIGYIKNFMLVFGIKLKTFSSSLTTLFHAEELNLCCSICKLVPTFLSAHTLSGLRFAGT